MNRQAQPTARDKSTFNRTLKAARIGDAQAQYELGLMYANGIGVQQDFEQAMQWVRQAADKGYVPAQYLLATRYAGGIAVEKDEQKAMAWYLRAAEQGHPKALYRLGKMFSQSHPQAAQRCLSQAAQLGVASAQMDLAASMGASAQLGEGGGGSEGSEGSEGAVHWYRSAAELGHAPAQCVLGDWYAKGQWVAPDMERALSWYRRAATQFYAPAQIALEALGQTGVGRRSATAKRKGAAAERRRDPAAWEASAANGDAACKYSYAVMCEQGWVVPHDEEAAQTWYLRSAKLGEPRAQHALAQILERQRDPQAMEWYRKAAEQGFVQAQTALGRLHAQRDQGGADALQSASWLLRAGLAQDRDALMALADALTRNPERLALACQQQAAALGEPHAQWALAQRYAQGLGVGPNPALALQWTQRAAQQGVPQAQCALGAFYIEGSAVPKDFGQAFHWFSQAAEQGDPKAQWNLGSLFASGGPGLKKDLRQAFAWCHKSADANFVPAQATLGVLYARIKDHERAAQCFKNAANDGDMEAQYNLGVLYSKGQGVEENQEQAFHWFARAAERGLVSAQARLALMLATGTGVAKDPLEAHKWLALAAAGGDASAQANLHKSEDQLLKSQITEAKRRAEVWKSQNPVTQ